MKALMMKLLVLTAASRGDGTAIWTSRWTIWTITGRGASAGLIVLRYWHLSNWANRLWGQLIAIQCGVDVHVMCVYVLCVRVDGMHTYALIMHLCTHYAPNMHRISAPYAPASTPPISTRPCTHPPQPRPRSPQIASDRPRSPRVAPD